MGQALANRVALVTGAGRRIGRAVALRLAQEGADVVVHYRSSEQEAREVVGEVEKLGRRAVAIPADLTQVAEIESLMARAGDHFGRLDVLVNNAANFLQRDFRATREADWNASLDTNLKAPFFCSQAAAPLLKKNRREYRELCGYRGVPGVDRVHSALRVEVRSGDADEVPGEGVGAGSARECDCPGNDHDGWRSARMGSGFYQAGAVGSRGNDRGCSGCGDVSGDGGVYDWTGFDFGWGKDFVRESMKYAPRVALRASMQKMCR